MQATILLVEDDLALQILLTRVLKEAGYSVIAAFDGQSALDQVDKERPDLVILDLMLPILSGYGFVAGLQQRGIRDLIRIIVTGATADTLAYGESIGAAAALQKPLDLPRFLEIVAAQLARTPTATA